MSDWRRQQLSRCRYLMAELRGTDRALSPKEWAVRLDDYNSATLIIIEQRLEGRLAAAVRITQ